MLPVAPQRQQPRHRMLIAAHVIHRPTSQGMRRRVRLRHLRNTRTKPKSFARSSAAVRQTMTSTGFPSSAACQSALCRFGNSASFAIWHRCVAVAPRCRTARCTHRHAPLRSLNSWVSSIASGISPVEGGKIPAATATAMVATEDRRTCLLRKRLSVAGRPLSPYRSRLPGSCRPAAMMAPRINAVVMITSTTAAVHHSPRWWSQSCGGSGPRSASRSVDAAMPRNSQ